MTNVMIKKRNLWIMLLLLIITLGFYAIYWFYKTKQEINLLGGAIPTFILFFIPIINLYFFYCYAKSFVNIVLKRYEFSDIIPYFFFITLLPGIAIFVLQYKLNKIAYLT